MTDTPFQKTPGLSRRTIIGWGIGMLLVVGLAAGGGLAYRPLKLRYAIHQLGKLKRSHTMTPPGWYLDCCLDAGRAGNGVAMEAGIDYLETIASRGPAGGSRDPVEELVKLGPPARDAIARLLKSKERDVPAWVLRELREQHASWALPLIIETTEDKNRQVALAAIAAVEKFAGRRFYGPIRVNLSLKRSRREVREWWESEGKAKYGRGGE